MMSHRSGRIILGVQRPRSETGGSSAEEGEEQGELAGKLRVIQQRMAQIEARKRQIDARQDVIEELALKTLSSMQFLELRMNLMRSFRDYEREVNEHYRGHLQRHMEECRGHLDTRPESRSTAGSTRSDLSELQNLSFDQDGLSDDGQEFHP